MATQLPIRRGKPDLRAEADALAKLSKVLASDPSAAVSCVLEIARGLCHAGTAGLSLLRTDVAADRNLRWELVRGALARYEGIEAPRANSPCGLCLDAGTTILVSRPARAFSWLEGPQPSIVETLIVPVQDDTGNVQGTLWIAHHEPSSRCTSDDVRILEQLTHQLLLALRLHEHARDRERGATLLQSLLVAQQRLLSDDVDRERIRRVQAEAAELEAERALQFKDAMIDEVNHRTKNTLMAASSLLTMQANATPSVEARIALLDSHARLTLLAEVHAMLCIEPTHAQTVFMPQLLQVMCNALAGSFGPTFPNVRLEVGCDPISLPADDAIAIALISNEAVTNSYKHAFADQLSGEINVQLHGSSERGMVLRISDSGTGKELAHGKDGLGLQLMRILSSQVHGALDVATSTRGAGTHVTLKIDGAASFGLPTQADASLT